MKLSKQFMTKLQPLMYELFVLQKMQIHEVIGILIAWKNAHCDEDNSYSKNQISIRWVKEGFEKDILRPVGDITDELEPLLYVLHEDYKLHIKHICFIFYSFAATFSPESIEEYVEDGSIPVFQTKNGEYLFYGKEG
jgi:hypothetical protein